MKKLLLLVLCFSIAKISSAQFALDGTSYTQDFNTLASGVPLPTGWVSDTGATSSSLGHDITNLYYKSPVSWNVSYGEFRNVASANGLAYFGSIDSASQKNVDDRAFGLRQVSGISKSFPGTDPGAAFVFEIANTNGLTAFNLNFKLQSLDSTSPRTTIWTVDYGVGDAPTTFTPVTTSPSTLTTGGNTFSNTPVTVDFGSALDNQSGKVWIRIVTLSASTGTGNRPTSAIDDFNLTWTGTANAVKNINVAQLPLTIAGDVTTNQIPVSFTTKEGGKATAIVYDVMGRQVYSSTIALSNGENHFVLSPESLNEGMYLVEVRNEKYYGIAKAIVK